MSVHTKAYAFKNQWLNMSLYFINFMYLTRKPFYKTTVGKLLNSRIGRLAIYSTAIPTVIATSVITGGASLYSYISTIIAIEAANDFAILYSRDYNNDTQVCKYITVIDRLKDTSDPLGGGQTNTKWLANGDYINTNFIKLDKTDIVSFFEREDNGFGINKTDLNSPNNYMRHPWNSGNMTNQERDPNNPLSNNNNNILYFLKGKGVKDVLLYTLYYTNAI